MWALMPDAFQLCGWPKTNRCAAPMQAGSAADAGPSTERMVGRHSLPDTQRLLIM
jgi:hypothetical protein